MTVTLTLFYCHHALDILELHQPFCFMYCMNELLKKWL